MTTYTLEDARARLPEVLAEARRSPGGVAIADATGTVRLVADPPLDRLNPADDADNADDAERMRRHNEAVAALFELRDQFPKFSYAEIRAMIEEGRQ